MPNESPSLSTPAEKKHPSRFAFKEWHLWILLFLIAFLPRFIYLNQIASSPFFHFPMGDAGKYIQRALAAYSKAYELDPRNYFALKNMALILEKTGQHEKARRLRKKAHRIRQAIDFSWK